jgi:hypothetical protein
MPFTRIFEVPLVYHTLICDRDFTANRYLLEYGDSAPRPHSAGRRHV